MSSRARTAALASLLGGGLGYGLAFVHIPILHAPKPLPLPGSREEASYIAGVKNEFAAALDIHELARQQRFTELHDFSQSELAKDSLSGVGRFLLRPRVFYDARQRELVLFMHLGEQLTGFRTVAHGGLLSVVITDAVNILAGQVRPGCEIKSINLSYKAPTFTHRTVMVECKLNQDDGLVYTKLMTPKGKLLVKATAELQQR